jgi:phosphoribosylformylglycinamidine synthase
MASKSKIMKSVINFANSGGMVMGICNGFQILVETGLVPGVLLRNKYLEFICKNVFVKINNKQNTYFKNIDNEVLEFHIAHNEGNYFCTKEQLKEIEITSKLQLITVIKKVKLKNSLILMDQLKILQGIFNKEKNVLGMMPHPERMIDPSLSGEDGSLFFNNLINNLK